MTMTRFALPLALAFVTCAAVAANDTKDTKDTKAKATPAAVKPVAANQPAASATQGRDWNKIDTNRDNLISPEEMEEWLKKNPGPQK